ncbi:phosphoribosylglycinamide formyltransferase [Companilactobacillus mishanensis]|uniref:Phosphoribosylglycinamide formyltransferase n=1 Tax=Companilactobacillus mishanensis TaxID=2486008 RepID=A0A5P0ZEM3_9LACO|nr:phosphoribosylglycinamide formyltransferase [Companilactobacillus mishanensis]MQS44397.1 phosphoribosylglycinamide formyltransferase [Companilactobacillus mishanensis]MQS51501.1 phosphoribosylglycinamide formyltransferase [Companilactobacillus mishanensis]MQS88638.1 phosphoribosylglycinamide formyltransferase [Companilactobacillus mishanensis]
MRVAIFASGNGTNFEALADDKRLLESGLEIVVLVCDKPKAKVIKKAQDRNIPVFVNKLSDYENRSQYEQAIVEKLAPLKIDYILLAGYMRVVTPTLLSQYPGKIINIHPSCLPKYSGLEAIERAFEAGENQTGVTIHYIDEGVDTGPVIRQAVVPILDTDTVDTLEARVHEKEHEIYPEVVLDLLKKFN